MNKTEYSDKAELLEKIHGIESKRRIRSIRLNRDGPPMRICLLDFILAPNYFISETGLIWNRSMFNTSRGYPDSGFCLSNVIDIRYPYRWFEMPNNMRSFERMPINQLLGWAFQPYVTTQKKYFVHKDNNFTYPYNLDDFIWVENLDKGEGDSPYLSFMSTLYG